MALGHAQGTHRWRRSLQLCANTARPSGRPRSMSLRFQPSRALSRSGAGSPCPPRSRSSVVAPTGAGAPDEIETMSSTTPRLASRNLVIFAESKRGRWRARGACFLYASTLDAGIAQLSAKITRFLAAVGDVDHVRRQNLVPGKRDRQHRLEVVCPFRTGPERDVAPSQSASHVHPRPAGSA